MTFPGGLIVSDNAGTLVFTKIKGTHSNEVWNVCEQFDAVQNNNLDADLESYEEKFVHLGYKLIYMGSRI